MKNLIFAVIVSVFYACNFSTEPGTTTPPSQPSTGKKKITTIMYAYNLDSRSVLYTGSAPDTVVPAYIQPQPTYTKVDSIWGFFYYAVNNWQVRINDGQVNHFNVKGSHLGQRFIKRWEK